jgi:hypothetical protein
MTFCGESSSPLKEKTINIYSHANAATICLYVQKIPEHICIDLTADEQIFSDISGQIARNSRYAG